VEDKKYKDQPYIYLKLAAKPSLAHPDQLTPCLPADTHVTILENCFSTFPPVLPKKVLELLITQQSLTDTTYL
jgi:hypothetical protein